MKKFISVLLSCSLICGNALGAETKSKETPSQTSTSSTAKESKNKKLKYGLISGGAGVIGTGVIAAALCALKHHKKSNKLTPTDGAALSPVDEPLSRVPEEALSLVDEYRVAGPVARRYKGELLNLPSHCVLNGEEFREYLSKFPDAPILLRGVNFDRPDKIDTYMSDFVKCGLAISSTDDANGLNIFGTEKADGRAVYFSSNISVGLNYAINYGCANGAGYLVLASFTRATNIADTICAARPRDNGDFILCTKFFKLTKNIDTLTYAKHLADYDFAIPDPSDENYESLSGIRDIQIWLLKLGIVIQRFACDFRVKNYEPLEEKFDPGRADELLKKLEPTEQLAS